MSLELSSIFCEVCGTSLEKTKMCYSETEKMEQKPAMNPAAAENGVMGNGSTNHAGRVGSLKPGHFPYGLRNNNKEILASIGIVSLVWIIILISSISSSALLGRSFEIFPTALPSPSTAAECCPDGWIGYQRKCYYFSESEENWTHSQNYCASFDASLVMIDSQEEMSFLRRYKGPADHWIGLQRMDDQVHWRWINGTIFNNWFKICGGGQCAYLNHQGVVASGSRTNDEYWICRKPVGTSCEILPTECCPDGWIGYQRKCYYFSASEGN